MILIGVSLGSAVVVSERLCSLFFYAQNKLQDPFDSRTYLI